MKETKNVLIGCWITLKNNFCKVKYLFEQYN